MEQSAFGNYFQTRLNPSSSTPFPLNYSLLIPQKHPISKLQFYFFKFFYSHSEISFLCWYNFVWGKDKWNDDCLLSRIIFWVSWSYWVFDVKKKIFECENHQMKRYLIGEA